MESTEKYYEKLNLIDNPFYPDPVNEYDEKPRGFINRENQLEQISMLLDDGRGKVLFLGDVGVGKTSLLKRGKFLARKKRFLALEISVHENPQFISFYLELIYQFVIQSTTKT